MTRLLLIVSAFFFLSTGAFLLWDHYTTLERSQNDRLTLLEMQMKIKMRPIIQVNQATIYNADGEVVVEGVKNGKDKN